MTKTYWVYILKCSDGSFYTGSSSNLQKRISEHQLGIIGSYTFYRRPVSLVFSQYFENPYEAISAERQIKGWSRAKKKALIAQDFELLVELSNAKNRKQVEVKKDAED